MLSKGEAAALLSLINAHHGNAQWDDVQLDALGRSTLLRGQQHGSLVRSRRHQRHRPQTAQRCETVRSADRPGVRTSGTGGRSGVAVSPSTHDGPFLGRVSTGGVDRA